jgi:3-dehydroquinate synthase
VVTQRVRLGTYDILIAPSLLDTAGAIVQNTAPAHRYAIVTDTNVSPLYAARLAAQFHENSVLTLTIPAGEAHKTRDTWSTLTDQLLANNFGRDSTVIALGGGVVGDLAGFVAATFMRGVSFVQIPTTLLAMIDASIGGKTGVDTPAGKNLVGAFHPPQAVLIDPVVLETLDLAHLRTGLAEAVKHGVIADETYFQFLQDAGDRLLRLDPTDRDPEFTFRLIERSVQIKADVVGHDEHEHGVRKILNFGHTIGHAIELLSGFALAHGDAVAIGMALETAAAERAGVADAGTTERIVATLTRIGLPYVRPAGPTADQIIDVMRGDKKSRAGSIEYAVPTRIGVMAGVDTQYGVRLDDTLVREILAQTSLVRDPMGGEVVG